MRMTVVRPNRRAVTHGIAERASLGHQAIRVTALSAADVAAYSTFIHRLRRVVVGVPAVPVRVRAR
jgi:hypothetical protein